MRKHRREQKMYKARHQVSAEGRRIFKMGEIIMIISQPCSMEEPLPHDSE